MNAKSKKKTILRRETDLNKWVNLIFIYSFNYMYTHYTHVPWLFVAGLHLQ